MGSAPSPQKKDLAGFTSKPTFLIFLSPAPSKPRAPSHAHNACIYHFKDPSQNLGSRALIRNIMLTNSKEVCIRFGGGRYHTR